MFHKKIVKKIYTYVEFTTMQGIGRWILMVNNILSSYLISPASLVAPSALVAPAALSVAPAALVIAPAALVVSPALVLVPVVLVSTLK